MRVTAMVALWHEGERKGQLVQTDDLRAFLDEIKEANKGYVVIGVKPIGEVDHDLWEEVTGEVDDIDY
jgi:hypothetical protein